MMGGTTDHKKRGLVRAGGRDSPRPLTRPRKGQEADSGISAINADGTDARKLTHLGQIGGDDLSWSPDGKRIAFVD